MAFPQGSVGLPFLKSCRPRPYTSDISSILTTTSVCGHLYADDRRSVLYLHGLAFGATAAVRSMNQTSGTRRSTICLQVNPPRTQFIWLATRQQLAKIDLDVIAADFHIYLFLCSHCPWNYAVLRARLLSSESPPLP